MKAFRTQPVGDGYLVVARFEQPVRAANVVRELGPVSRCGRRPAGRVAWSSTTGRAPSRPSRSATVPPDVVLRSTGPAGRAPSSPGRAPVAAEPDAIGPFDERVLNPIGFWPTSTGRSSSSPRSRGQPSPPKRLVRSLRSSAGADRSPRRVPPTRPLVAVLSVVRASRLVLPWTPRRTGRPDRPVGARGAQRGATPGGARGVLDGGLAATAADGTAYASRPEPSVSVVLATKRPEMLAFALRQVRKQRGVDLQLVLAPHGFTPDADVLRELGPERARRPATGRVHAVRRRARRRGGRRRRRPGAEDGRRRLVRPRLRHRPPARPRVLGRRAGRHTGRDALPGAERDVTVRRGHRSELLRALRRRRDHAGRPRPAPRGGAPFGPCASTSTPSCSRAIGRAGAAIYRTHGLGYLLRRNASGHTWQVDEDYLLDPARVAEIRPGFAPSRLLEYDESERPTAG